MFGKHRCCQREDVGGGGRLYHNYAHIKRLSWLSDEKYRVKYKSYKADDVLQAIVSLLHLANDVLQAIVSLLHLADDVLQAIVELQHVIVELQHLIVESSTMTCWSSTMTC